MIVLVCLLSTLSYNIFNSVLISSHMFILNFHSKALLLKTFEILSGTLGAKIDFCSLLRNTTLYTPKFYHEIILLSMKRMCLAN